MWTATKSSGFEAVGASTHPTWGRRTLERMLFAVSLLLTSAIGCWSETQQPATGGETHFLTWCSAEGSACGGELSCLCGACSVPCDDHSACGDYPGAECIVASEPGACGLLPSVSRCEVRCVTDEDCEPLSIAHRCESGLCRAAPTTPPAVEPLTPLPAADACAHGNITANEVLLIGDSFFAANRQLPRDLAQLAALGTDESYRDASRLANNALALMGNGIAEQYTAAATEAQPKVVIMTGGGADVLLGTCEPNDAQCPLLAEAADAARALLSRMAQDGVEHVVYAFYPDPLDATVRERMDGLRPLIQLTCNESPVPCHWLDLRPAFAGHYDEYIQADGLNPTAAGSRVAAEQIWALLRSACIVP